MLGTEEGAIHRCSMATARRYWQTAPHVLLPLPVCPPLDTVSRHPRGTLLTTQTMLEPRRNSCGVAHVVISLESAM